MADPADFTAANDRPVRAGAAGVALANPAHVAGIITIGAILFLVVAGVGLPRAR